MGDEGSTRRPYESAEPVERLLGISVFREILQHRNFCAYGNVLAVYLYGLGTADDRCAARAARLKAGKQNGIARIGRESLQVMQDPSAGPHAACGEDDHGASSGVQGLRFLDGIDEPGRRAHGPALFFGEPMLRAMTMIEIRRVHCHGAVEVDREIGNPI